MATKPRGWTGARTPSAIKRVRTAARRAEINQPRRSAAKTLVAKALRIATTDAQNAGDALAQAISALDRAAKVGAIHPNAASRRKSRLTLKVNAALEGTDGPDRGPHRQDDRRGRRSKGREGAPRGVSRDEGEGPADGGRQGTRGAVSRTGPLRPGRPAKPRPTPQPAAQARDPGQGPDRDRRRTTTKAAGAREVGAPRTTAKSGSGARRRRPAKATRRPRRSKAAPGQGDAAKSGANGRTHRRPTRAKTAKS